MVDSLYIFFILLTSSCSVLFASARRRWRLERFQFTPNCWRKQVCLNIIFTNTMYISWSFVLLSLCTYLLQSCTGQLKNKVSSQQLSLSKYFEWGYVLSIRPDRLCFYVFKLEMGEILNKIKYFFNTIEI